MKFSSFHKATRVDKLPNDLKIANGRKKNEHFFLYLRFVKVNIDMFIWLGGRQRICWRTTGLPPYIQYVIIPGMTSHSSCGVSNWELCINVFCLGCTIWVSANADETIDSSDSTCFIDRTASTIRHVEILSLSLSFSLSLYIWPLDHYFFIVHVHIYGTSSWVQSPLGSLEK